MPTRRVKDLVDDVLAGRTDIAGVLSLARAGAGRWGGAPSASSGWSPRWPGGPQVAGDDVPFAAGAVEDERRVAGHVVAALVRQLLATITVAPSGIGRPRRRLPGVIDGPTVLPKGYVSTAASTNSV